MKIANVVTALSIVASAIFLSSGGGERFCQGGVEFEEKWYFGAPGADIPWTILTAAGSALPGYPPLDPSQNIEDNPGLQSIVRAIETWNNVTVPGGGSASTLRFATAPTAIVPYNIVTPCNPTNGGALGFDGINMITAHQPSGFWLGTGGPLTTSLVTAFAVAPVSAPIVGGLATIVEFDIAINTYSQVSFVEDNDLYGKTYASLRICGYNSFAQPQQFQGDPGFAPEVDFVDLQGLLTHEFGHAAGLGHSMVDAQHSGGFSAYPTMYPIGQSEDYSGVQVWNVDSGVAPIEAVHTSPADVTLLMRSAQDLQPDDISAIGSTYPTPAFQATGSISGTVQLQDAAGIPGPVLGAHVIATRIGNPGAGISNIERISTLSYAGGAYVIEGLVPGNYLIEVEPVDASSGRSDGYLFNNGDVPNYVQSGVSVCAPIPREQFVREFWDSAESFSEAHQSAASVVTVPSSGNQSVPGIDLLCEPGVDMLKVRVFEAASPRFSSRGVNAVGSQSPNGISTIIEMEIDAPLFAGQPARILMSTGRDPLVLPALFENQYLQLPGTSLTMPISPIDPSVPVGDPLNSSLLDSNGRGTFRFVLTPGLAYNTLLFQAITLSTTTGTLKFSNVVSSWQAFPYKPR